MIRIGITGHTRLSATTVQLVDAEIRGFLAEHEEGGYTGVSCLAAGADTLFAQAVVDAEQELEVVIPSSDYRRHIADAEQLRRFDRLSAAARRVTTMPFSQAGQDAYRAANEVLVSTCDILVAVWDGEAAVDPGGTAAVVRQASASGVPLRIIWPAGARRLGQGGPGLHPR